MEWVNFKVEEGERERLKDDAYSHRMNISEYLRFLIEKERKEQRNEVLKSDNLCCGCIYENIDDTIGDISKCVCCKRNVDFAKNDYYMRKEDEKR